MTIDSSFSRCLTFVTHILNICLVMSTFLLVGQQACNFLAMSFHTVSSSPSGTWSHLLQTKMAHSGSNWCDSPFSSNSNCFFNIFISCNDWNQIYQKQIDYFLEMIIKDYWPKPNQLTLWTGLCNLRLWRIAKFQDDRHFYYIWKFPLHCGWNFPLFLEETISVFIDFN